MNWRGKIGLGAMLWALVLVLAVAWADTGVAVVDAWIRLAPPGVTALGGYLTIQNGSQPRSLVGARSAEFGSVTIHRSVMKDGMARMEHAARVPLASDTRLVFAPGGLHLMLMNPRRGLRLGDRVEIQLEFSDGRRMPVSFEVRK